MISKLIEIKELALRVKRARDKYKQEREKLEVLQTAEGVELAIEDQKKEVVKAARKEEEAIDALLESIEIL